MARLALFGLLAFALCSAQVYAIGGPGDSCSVDSDCDQSACSGVDGRCGGAGAAYTSDPSTECISQAGSGGYCRAPATGVLGSSCQGSLDTIYGNAQCSAQVACSIFGVWCASHCCSCVTELNGCSGGPGAKCTQGLGQCVSGICNSGVCQAAGASMVGSSCPAWAQDQQCDSNPDRIVSCSQGICGGNGSSCSSNIGCASGNCVGNTCAAPAGAGLGASCISARGCDSVAGGQPVSCGSLGICGGTGAPCSIDAQCASGTTCFNNYCRPANAPIGQQCLLDPYNTGTDRFCGSTLAGNPAQCSGPGVSGNPQICQGIGAMCRASSSTVFGCAPGLTCAGETAGLSGFCADLSNPGANLGQSCSPNTICSTSSSGAVTYCNRESATLGTCGGQGARTVQGGQCAPGLIPYLVTSYYLCVPDPVASPAAFAAQLGRPCYGVGNCGAGSPNTLLQCSQDICGGPAAPCPNGLSPAGPDDSLCASGVCRNDPNGGFVICAATSDASVPDQGTSCTVEGVQCGKTLDGTNYLICSNGVCGGTGAFCESDGFCESGNCLVANSSCNDNRVYGLRATCEDPGAVCDSTSSGQSYCSTGASPNCGASSAQCSASDQCESGSCSSNVCGGTMPSQGSRRRSRYQRRHRERLTRRAHLHQYSYGSQ